MVPIQTTNCEDPATVEGKEPREVFTLFSSVGDTADRLRDLATTLVDRFACVCMAQEPSPTQPECNKTGAHTEFGLKLLQLNEHLQNTEEMLTDLIRRAEL